MVEISHNIRIVGDSTPVVGLCESFDSCYWTPSHPTKAIKAISAFAESNNRCLSSNNP